MDARIARKIMVEGRVTGVGFRWHVMKVAEGCPQLDGHVRNVGEQSVECVVQGDERNVELVTRACRRGPFMARVAHVTVVDIPLDNSLGTFHVSS